MQLMFVIVYWLYLVDKIGADESSPVTNGNKQKNEIQKPIMVAVEPQAGVGVYTVEYLGRGDPLKGGSDWGGELTYVKNLMEAVACSNEFQAWIFGQQIINSCHGKFGAAKEYLPACRHQVIIQRALIDTIELKYTDKEEIDTQTGLNKFYRNLDNWAEKLEQTVENLPEVFQMNYFSGLMATFHLLSIAHSKMRLSAPAPVLFFVPHSLGWLRLISMIEKNVKAKIGKTQIPLSKLQDLIRIEARELKRDERFLFPLRLTVERIGAGHPQVHVILSSVEEIQMQMMSTPYSMPFTELPPADIEKMHVVPPGIDKSRFDCRDPVVVDKMALHISHAKARYEAGMKMDILVERQQLPCVVVAGRLTPDKNFISTMKAFVFDPHLRDKANLVYVINGADGNNMNYIRIIQKLLMKYVKPSVVINRVELDPIEKKLVSAFSKNQLIVLVEIAEYANQNPELVGCLTSLSLPNGNDFAGLALYLGQTKKGIFVMPSKKEPFGLLILEFLLAGNLAAVSKQAGAAEKLIKAGVKSFNTMEFSNEIQALDQARAIRETLEIDTPEYRNRLYDFTASKTWADAARKLVTLSKKFMQEPQRKAWQPMSLSPTNHVFMATCNQLYDEAIGAALVNPKSQYIGCFKDDISRDLKFNFISGSVSMQQCLQQCKYFQYFALQNGNECFCGNSYGRLGSAPENECNMKCSADADQTCGGGWRNSVYRNPESNQNGYIGCYKDDISRDLKSNFVTGTVSIEQCRLNCKEFEYFGMQNGNECFCGNSYGRLGEATDTDCGVKCSGNGAQICGGGWRNSVYRVNVSS